MAKKLKKDEIIKKLFIKNYEKILDVGSEDSSLKFLRTIFPNSKIFCLNLDKNILPIVRESIKPAPPVINILIVNY